MRVLVTGAAGFVGPVLIQQLATEDPDTETWGLVWGRDPRRPPSAAQPIPGDLTDRSSIRTALEASHPDVIYHLAAASSVASSWQHPQRVLDVNLCGSINLFEAIRELDLDPLVVVASSGEIYGAVATNEQPIGEDLPLRPLSPYAASKAALDLATEQYGARFGLRAMRLRMFHHTGPGRPPIFVASSFAEQLARIELGLAPPRLAVGNLDAVRDFTDVRDIARAYRMAAASGTAGEAYNVCSGRGLTIRELLDQLLDLTDIEVEVTTDPQRLRANDIPHLVGDNRKFATATGWQPGIPLQTTLADLLDWWRHSIAESPPEGDSE
jgi:GDP-4-dehydro-6-deoxy-D-mannose reductase